MKIPAFFFFVLLFVACKTAQPPQPYGALPTPQQVEWQKMEYYMFVHFGPNTFTDMEWGHGDEDPKVFNPTQLDCRQWAAVAKEAGMKAIIITAKHHDGFSLWPSHNSTHTVRESTWKEGKGDVLRELSDACKEYGLKFGVYLSPWDRNHPTYGTDEYNDTFANTLTEVLTGYGDVFEQWFDGANGEGPNGKKQVYDWRKFVDVVHKYHPKAMIFGSSYPTIRWIGNENGYANTRNWVTYIPGRDGSSRAEGNEGADQWIPAEVDVSIRPGWFYSAYTDNQVKSIGKLMDIWHSSVGRNSNLLLNVPPDRRGLIHQVDSARLMDFARALKQIYSKDLTKGAKARPGSIREGSRQFDWRNLFDDDYDSYWTVDDDILSESIEIILKGEQTFNRLMVQEYIPLGQRVRSFSIEYWDNGIWKLIDKQSTIGYKRILRFPTVTAERIRINIENSHACPVLSKIGIFYAEEILESPQISRNRQGKVFIWCDSADPVIHYTIDGSVPTKESPKYEKEFDMIEGGVVKAKTFVEGRSSETVDAYFDLATAKWSITGTTLAGQARAAIDGNPGSVYNSAKEKSIAINLGEEIVIKGFTYTPIEGSNGNIYQYQLYISSNGRNWTRLIEKSSFDNIQNNPIKQIVNFEQPVKTSYLMLESLAPVEQGEYSLSIAEIGVIVK